jgi:WD40 repeat protein
VSDYDIIKIWDIEKGNSPNTFYIQNGVTKVVSVSDDGKRAMVGNWDNTLRLWDIEKSKSPAIIIKQHFVKEIDSSWEGEYTVFPGSDNTICVLNLKTGEIVKEIAGSSRSVTSICASENVDVIAVTEYLKNTINIFDLKKNQIRFTLDGHTDSLNCICVTGDGKRIISGAHDYTLKIWDIDKRMCLLTFRDKSCPIQISVSFDGSRIVTAHWFDKNLLVWDMESGKCHSVLTGHLNNIDTVKVTANGLYAISSSWDNTMRLWDLNCGKCLSVVYVGKRISSIGLSKNNNFIAAGTSTGEVLFFEISNL